MYRATTISPETCPRQNQPYRRKTGLNYLLQNLAFYGLYCKNKSSIWYTALIFSTFITVEIYCICYIIMFNPPLSLRSFISFIAYWSEAVSALLLYIISLYHKKRVLAGIETLLKLSQWNGTQITGKKDLIKILLAWLNGISLFACLITSEVNHSTTAGNLYGINVINASKSELNVIGNAVFTTFISVFLCLQMSLFIGICNQIEVSFKDLYSNLTSSNNLSEEGLLAIIDIHTNLCEIVDSCEVVYSPVLFMWTTASVIKLIFCGHHLIITRNKNTFIQDAVLACCINVYQICLFISVCCSASSVADAAATIITAIYKKAFSCKNQAVRTLAFQFYYKCLHEPPYYTACNLYTINRRLLIIVSGAVISCVFIAIQFTLSDYREEHEERSYVTVSNTYTI